MIDKAPKNCTGCSACMNACPKDAINISYENSFFYEPKVDYNKCVSCKKCVSVCPALDYTSFNSKNPKTYAAYAHDAERKTSASGGVFPVIAKWILQNGGYVCGAAWSENWDVHHIIIDNVEDLQKLKVSKYVQSYVGDVFTKIKELLSYGKTVLFSGTPCQNAGLRKFLGRDYDNLYMMDLLCHGAPSPRIWQDYLTKNFDKQNIKEINFRSKENGWISTRKLVYDKSGSFVKTDEAKPVGIFYEAFLNHKINNESCMECKYRYIPRPGDFTIGDFWHYPAFDKTLNDGKGLSVMLLNSKKTEALFENFKVDFKHCQRLNLKKQWEHIEVTNRSRANTGRTLLFKNYEKYGVNKSLELACGKHFDVALLSMFMGMNYGSGLVTYAINKILEKLGYSVLNVYKLHNAEVPLNAVNMNWRFAQRNYYMSRFFDKDESCRELNDAADAFVVGSDTLWWWADVDKTGFHYWLDFVEADKKKVSFCTSFAHSQHDAPRNVQRRLKYLYSRFDALSVREKDGVGILRDTYGVDSEYLLDPTLLLEKEEWEKLEKAAVLTPPHTYVLVYVLDDSKDKKAAYERIAESLKLDVYKVPNPSRTKKTVELEDFLRLIANAAFVFTDSFHGTCFSVIFKKPFLTFRNRARGGSRYKTFEEMELSDRLIDGADFDAALLSADIDFSLADAVIVQKREKALKWLDTALKKQKSEPSGADKLYDYYHAELEARDESTIRLSRRFMRLYKKVYKICRGRIRKIAKLCAAFAFLSLCFVVFLIVMIFVK